MGKSLDKFLHQEWLNDLTPTQREAVEWAIKKYKITGDRSYELIAEDPAWATILYENDWENHAKPFFEGFDNLPLTYYELAISNLSQDLEGFILDNSPIHQDTLPESWDSLTCGSESDDELSTPTLLHDSQGLELDTSPKAALISLTDTDTTPTLTPKRMTPSLNPEAEPFAPSPRE